MIFFCFCCVLAKNYSLAACYCCPSDSGHDGEPYNGRSYVFVPADPCPSPSLRPLVLLVDMKDPSISSGGPNMTTGTELILTSQFNAEDDPFAEYMWMENEEEFNRQVRSWDEDDLDCK